MICSKGVYLFNRKQIFHNYPGHGTKSTRETSVLIFEHRKVYIISIELFSIHHHFNRHESVKETYLQEKTEDYSLLQAV